jgi:hypothetical protein
MVYAIVRYCNTPMRASDFLYQGICIHASVETGHEQMIGSSDAWLRLGNLLKTVSNVSKPFTRQKLYINIPCDNCAGNFSYPFGS